LVKETMMSEDTERAAAHTPGPWLLDLGNDGAFAIYVAPDVDMGWALVLASRGQNTERADEMHANGRLMAAAPELLEALQQVVEVLDAALMIGIPTLPPDADGPAAIARAAIQKATGSPA